MTPLVIQIIIGAASLLVGLLLGWTLGSRRKSKRNVIVDLESRLEQAIESRADYEAEVTEHFTKTAELLNQMTQNYSAIYNHLATGADTLCEGNVAIAGAALHKGDNAELPPSMVDVTQPLDYAPKREGEDEGQLSEKFGLEKPVFAEADDDARASA